MARAQHVTKDNKIYGNCQVLSPDGILMFRCDAKKANWYIKRNLAEIVNDNPLIIKLNFAPNGLGNHNKEFGLGEMENKCVICGCDDFLTRHHVVPYCYRKFFPLNLKSHNFHDVLSICVDCHEKYERRADELKNELAIKYKAPTSGIVENNSYLLKYIRNASTVLYDSENIPASRIKIMKGEIKSFFKIKRLTKTRLEKIASMKNLTIIKKSHGEMVVEQIDDIQEFVEMWRKHFIESAKPKYLPENWKISNSIYKQLTNG